MTIHHVWFLAPAWGHIAPGYSIISRCLQANEQLEIDLIYHAKFSEPPCIPVVMISQAGYTLRHTLILFSPFSRQTRSSYGIRHQVLSFHDPITIEVASSRGFPAVDPTSYSTVTVDAVGGRMSHVLKRGT